MSEKNPEHVQPAAPEVSDTKGSSRRTFIKAAGAAGLAAAVGPFIIPKARAAKKTLKILQWNHLS